MAKRSKQKKTTRDDVSLLAPTRKESHPQPNSPKLLWSLWLPLLLAMVTFLAYWPSLYSDFVYDDRAEILEEGFITSLSNLPDVLSLKVLGMHLMLAGRPGQLLYLMLIAAVSGKDPFGYHLCSNLLHAGNVALLFILLRRLISTESPGLEKSSSMKAQMAAASVTLLFALHPIAAEPVCDVSYSSDLLVTFFTLLALLAASAFRPENLRFAMLTGATGTLSALAGVACKESGIATALLLIVYWFLFRRREAKAAWLVFLGAATAVTVLFLVARFLLALPSEQHLDYLGGSFSQLLLIQPKLWVFMLGKLLWPVQFSVDYRLEEVSGLATAAALAILGIVVLLQAWLAAKSRMGALGVTTYWLGLLVVSNFIPLFCALADRYYYLPLAGVAMQLLALILMTLKTRWGFWAAVVSLVGALLPLALLTQAREAVFASEFALWSDTIQVSPRSSIGHLNVGNALMEKGQVDAAITQFQTALEICPNYAEAHYNLGNALFGKGQVDEALAHYQTAVALKPTFALAHYNLGIVLLQKGRADEAIAQFQMDLEIHPNHADGYTSLGNALLQKGPPDEAIVQYQKALEINPDFAEIHENLGSALLQKGRVNEAIAQFHVALRLKPDYRDAQNNLAKALVLARHAPGSK